MSHYEYHVTSDASAVPRYFGTLPSATAVAKELSMSQAHPVYIDVYLTDNHGFKDDMLMPTFYTVQKGKIVKHKGTASHV